MGSFAVLADFRDACGESPLWDAEQNALYWTDLTGKKFYRYDWAEKRASLLSSGFEICGFAFDEQGGFVVVNSEGIWKWDGRQIDPGAQPVCLAAEVDGVPCRMNDCA